MQRFCKTNFVQLLALLILLLIFQSAVRANGKNDDAKIVLTGAQYKAVTVAYKDFFRTIKKTGGHTDIAEYNFEISQSSDTYGVYISLNDEEASGGDARYYISAKTFKVIKKALYK